MTDPYYDGARALVVGGTGGIGRAFVDEFLAHGATVAFTFATNETRADDIRSAAAAMARACTAHRCDLRDRASIAAACRAIVDALGVPTHLVTCAGLLRDRPMFSMTDDDWDAVVQANLDGPFHLLRLLAPLMARGGGGRIVNVASVGGMFGAPGQTAYAASKGGVIALTRAMARELGPFRVTVNAVAPGFVTTAMTDGVSESAKRRLLERIPLRRFGTPEDVVRAARVLLAADTTYITGHVLVVDGGLTC